MRLLMRVLFGKKRNGDFGMLLMLVLLGAAAAALFNSEDVQRLVRMRRM
jgi:hypothetical protein